LIKTERLTKRFGHFTAVENLTLNIRAGEIYGFLGPNGAGKTTTILMLLGILKPTMGSISLFGQDFYPDRLDLKKRIGVVPERHPTGMWKWMTAHEYLSLFADLYLVSNFENRSRRLLEMVELHEVENKKIIEFSRGMLQKLSIVRALLHDPDILFLDEPISGLDPMGIKRVRELICSENREGRTIFISSHLLSEIEKICHRVAIISSGRLLAEEKMDSLLTTLMRDKEIHIELEEIPRELPGQIKKMDFVIDCFTDGESIVVKVPKKGDYRKRVVKFFMDRHLIPLKVEERSASLEEAFTILTQENVKMFSAKEEQA
jgi:ABC-type multidrug transport system ATPase subunit